MSVCMFETRGLVFQQALQNLLDFLAKKVNECLKLKLSVRHAKQSMEALYFHYKIFTFFSHLISFKF